MGYSPWERKGLGTVERLTLALPYHFMANRQEECENTADFIFLGSKINVDGECRDKSKRRLLLGRKAMTNLDSILKSRDITLLTKVYIVKAMFCFFFQ